jgi:hypothetical protein
VDHYLRESGRRPAKRPQVRCPTHTTPWGKPQDFTYVVLRRLAERPDINDVGRVCTTPTASRESDKEIAP